MMAGKFIDISKLSHEEYASLCTFKDEEERKKELSKFITKYNNNSNNNSSVNNAVNTVNIRENIAKMTFLEEAACVLFFAFGIPGAAITVPVTLSIVGYILLGSVLKMFAIAALIMVPLSIFFPVRYDKSIHSSWLSYQMLRYFSMKVIYEEETSKSEAAILVAPPHGLFPFGNILTMLAYPALTGYNFFGLAADSALKAPIFRYILTITGTISAGRASVKKALEENKTLGLSSGGVAEIFECNSSEDGDETIILKNRKGMVKIAIQTGAKLVPCYLFGNTSVLSVFAGGSLFHHFLRRLSRSAGFAFVLFWGRFFLPIPYRHPILGVMGKAIHVTKNDNPTQEEIDRIHAQLLDDMQNLFDKYKGIYGWGHKRLVIE